jgi:hypothetical protein
MTRLCRPQSLIWPLLLLLCAGCSRPALRSDNSAQAAPHPVPFHDGDTSGTPNLSPTSATTETGASVPFHDGQSLPVGTLLTVRLTNPISSNSLVASGTFEAIVDEPIVIEGNTLVPKGASVAGRVESAQSPTTKRRRGLVRLTLDQMDIAGRDLPIQTSSLFAPGKVVADKDGIKKDSSKKDSFPKDSPKMVSLEKGRQLTFRLTEAVDMAIQPAIPTR